MSGMLRGLLALAVTALLTTCALADKRVALVVANGAYGGAPLQNPSVDAGLVQAALTKVGFAVEVVRDADLDSFDAAVRRFGETAKGADIAVFYFAGHGFAVNEGLKPVSILMSTSADVAKGSERQLRGNGIPLDDIVQQLAGVAGATLIFVDACRNDPRISRAIGGGRGFSRIEPARSSALMIGLSTRLGDTAADGEPGKGSPFARAFAANIDAPGLRIDDAFRQIRTAVDAETGGKQLPDIVQDDLPTGAIILAGVEPTPPAQTPAADAKLTEAGQVWAVIRESKDADELEAFRQRYPGTFYADMAAEKLKKLAPSQIKPQQSAIVEPDRTPVPPAAANPPADCNRLAPPATANNTPVGATAAVAACEQAIAEVAPRLGDSIVAIVTQRAAGGDGEASLPQGPAPSPFEKFFDDFTKERLGGGTPRKTASLHAGFIIDQSGIIVTNYHAINGVDAIIVRLADGSRLAAKVLGRDTRLDLALLKIQADKPLKAVKFAGGGPMRVGDWALAAANPLREGGKATLQVTSAVGVDMNVGPYDNYIKSDAPIDSTDLGGPLFDAAGDVVGINSILLTTKDGKKTATLALPSAMAVPIIEQLRQYGETRRGWIGVKIQPVTDDIAESLGMDKTAGALVAGIDDKGPAKPADLLSGDIIVKFDGHDIREMRDLPRIVADTPVDKTVDVVILRKGQSLTKQLKIARLDEADKPVKVNVAQPNVTAKPKIARALGLEMSGITSELRSKYKLVDGTKGVLVTSVDPGSAAEDKRVKPGDVIVQVGQQVVSTPEDVTRRFDELRKNGTKQALLLLSNSAGELRFVAISVD